MDHSVIEQGLKPSANTSARIDALLEAGIDTETIAETAEVTSASVRNWRYGDTQPRRESHERLDDLRYAMSLLVVGQRLAPAEASTWMQSRTAEPPFARPYEMLRDQPQTVFAMIGDRSIRTEVSVEEVASQEDTGRAEESEWSDIEESVEEPDGYELNPYAEELYKELEPIAQTKLPHATLFGILRHFPDWQYTNERVGNQSMGVLTRHFEDPWINLQVPEDYEQQQVQFSHQSVAIQAAAICGNDVRCLIDLERQLHAPQRARAIEIQRTIEAQPKPALPKLTEIQKKFRESKGIFAHEDDLFTGKESVALSQLTYNVTQQALGNVLGVSSSTICRLLKPVNERVGTTTNTDLMLAAIALEIADIEHVPAGFTSCLNRRDLKMISDHYSPDPEVRAAARKQSDSSRWSRIYDKLGILDAYSTNTRNKTVLYALRDGIIELPDADQIREHIAAKKAETALAV